MQQIGQNRAVGTKANRDVVKGHLQQQDCGDQQQDEAVGWRRSKVPLGREQSEVRPWA